LLLERTVLMHCWCPMRHPCTPSSSTDVVIPTGSSVSLAQQDRCRSSVAWYIICMVAVVECMVKVVECMVAVVECMGTVV
jgi:hypothetical protein